MRFLRDKGVDLELAQRAGLVAERKSGGFYDRLRDRLVFPITDPGGRVVSFGGRVLGAGEPKYLNGPETEVFHKGTLLYGLSQASQELRQTRRALLVEGYLDVIRLHEAGYRTALATLGTAVTREHLQLLRRRADEMVLIYDGDAAGRAAAFRALDVVLLEELPCRGVLLPDGEDPDSFVQGGGDLRGRLDAAQPLLDLYVRDRIEAAEPGGVAATVGALDAVLEKLRAVRDPVVRDLYLRRVAESVGIDEALLRRRLVESTAQRRSEPAPEQVEAPPLAVDPVERELLRALVSSPEDRLRFTQGCVEQWVRSPAALSALRYVVGQQVGAAHLEVEAAPPPARRLLSEILVEGEVRGDPYEALVARLQLRALEVEAASLLAELRRAEAGNDGARVGQLLQRQLQLGKDLAACKQQVRGRSGK
jgi:DNA primase